MCCVVIRGGEGVLSGVCREGGAKAEGVNSQQDWSLKAWNSIMDGRRMFVNIILSLTGDERDINTKMIIDRYKDVNDKY